MASGPSACNGESSANPLEPVGSMFPCKVQPLLPARTMVCTGSNVMLKILGLGGAPCATPRHRIHTAVLPNKLTMTRKEPVYILRNKLISSTGKPLASRMKRIALWFTALKAFLMSRYKTVDTLSFCLRCSARMLLSLPNWRLVLRFRRNPSCVSSLS